jgi:hypothetical protein
MRFRVWPQWISRNTTSTMVRRISRWHIVDPRILCTGTTVVAVWKSPDTGGYSARGVEGWGSTIRGKVAQSLYKHTQKVSQDSTFSIVMRLSSVAARKCRLPHIYLHTPTSRWQRTTAYVHHVLLLIGRERLARLEAEPSQETSVNRGTEGQGRTIGGVAKTL